MYSHPLIPQISSPFPVKPKYKTENIFKWNWRFELLLPIISSFINLQNWSVERREPVV